MINQEQMDNNWTELMSIIDKHFEGEQKENILKLHGDFEDEYDIKDEVIHTKKDGSYIINTSISITKFNQRCDNIIQSEYESLAGYIIIEIGRIPKNREVFFLSI